jgi:NADPH:quinone reductase-like Zn-dependent oxidoreductase
MQAITVRDRDAGVGGLSLTDMPYPRAAENDVIVRVHAAGFTPGELDWPGTWSDTQRLRSGRLKPHVGAVRPLAEAPAAFAPARRTPGKTIIRII